MQNPPPASPPPGGADAPDAAVATAAAGRLGPPAPAPRGLYVHVPFCAHTCEFCAFYQVRPEGDAIDRYLGLVEEELRLLPPAAGHPTVFWGGGTPGLLNAAQTRRLGEAVLGAGGGRAPEEWTVELAPGSVRAPKLAVLRGLGVTRVSLGVQSFQPRLLEALGRRHDAGQVRRALDLVRAAGFPSVNADLIFAVPGQTDAEWEADLAAVVAAGVDHVSTYCLTFEEDTALFARLAAGQVRVDEEREARLQERTHEVLEAAGFAHYEVSNYARPGHACRHNLHTWRMGQWSGVGPSAASQELPWRGANPPDLAAWEADVRAGRRARTDRTELGAAALAVDALVFGLRLAEGVDWSRWRRALPPAAAERLAGLWDDLAAAGLLVVEADGRVRPTPRGFLVADGLGTEVLLAAGA